MEKTSFKGWIFLSIFCVLSLGIRFSYAQESGFQKPANLVPLNPLPMADASLGSAQAPVTIICYSSFTCTHCAEFHKKVFPYLKEKYIDTGCVRYVMKDYPLDRVALKASQLAHSQGVQNYIRNADVFYIRQKDWLLAADPEKVLIKIAKGCGISEKDGEKALQNKDLRTSILSQRLYAQNSLKILHTPAFVINGKMVEGYLTPEALDAYIKESQTQEN